MTMATKNEIFQEFLSKYLRASRASKHEILNHVTAVTDMHRKAAIRKFRVLQMRDSAHEDRRGRRTYYTPDVTAALKDIWEAGSEVCGELLHPVIHEYVDIFMRDNQWKHGDETTAKLRAMSEKTMKRRIGAFMKARTPRSGLSLTKPSHIKSVIPVFTGPWEDKPPGFGQVDSVAHCGSSMAGDMVFSVNFTDVATLWGVHRAQWNKGEVATQESLEATRGRLPFTMRGAHPDTGSEFINWHTLRWCTRHGIDLTRSRPYHKNDNAYVEQTNGHVIRRFLGYTRLDCRSIVPVMNELYDVLDAYLNHFVSVRKCVEKVRIGARYKRVYDTAKTPYRRVRDHQDVDETVKVRLRKEHEKLNPLVLKKKVDTLISKIMKLQRDYRNQNPHD